MQQNIQLSQADQYTTDLDIYSSLENQTIVESTFPYLHSLDRSNMSMLYQLLSEENKDFRSQLTQALFQLPNQEVNERWRNLSIHTALERPVQYRNIFNFNHMNMFVTTRASLLRNHCHHLTNTNLVYVDPIHYSSHNYNARIQDKYQDMITEFNNALTSRKSVLKSLLNIEQPHENLIICPFALESKPGKNIYGIFRSLDATSGTDYELLSNNFTKSMLNFISKYSLTHLFKNIDLYTMMVEDTHIISILHNQDIKLVHDLADFSAGRDMFLNIKSPATMNAFSLFTCFFSPTYWCGERESVNTVCRSSQILFGVSQIRRKDLIRSILFIAMMKSSFSIFYAPITWDIFAMNIDYSAKYKDQYTEYFRHALATIYSDHYSRAILYDDQSLEYTQLSDASTMTIVEIDLQREHLIMQTRSIIYGCARSLNRIKDIKIRNMLKEYYHSYRKLENDLCFVQNMLRMHSTKTS